MNTWTTLDEQGTNKLTYWPQVNPSPLTVSLATSTNIGSLEIVIVNNTALDIAVCGVEFLIPIGPDGNVLTSTTNGILTAVSDSDNWKITPPSEIITSGKARYELLPKNLAGTPVTIAKGKSVAVQIYGFTTNKTPGTPTIEIKEAIGSGSATPCAPPERATTSFTVTIFPWGFAFSDLVANVRVGGALTPIAQVDRTQPVILTWQSSVVDTSSYTVYCSTNQGQQTYPVSTPGEWTTPTLLTADTVFTLVVSVKNTAGVKLYSSMSLAVAVTNPDLVAKSVTAKGLTIGPAGNQQPSWTIDSSSTSLRFNNSSTPAATASLSLTGELSVPASVTAQKAILKGLTIGPAGNQQPSWTIDSSSTSLRFNNSSTPAATASLGLTGEFSVTALLAGKDGMGPTTPCALVAHGDLAISSRVFVGDTTNAQKDGKRVPTKGLVLDGAYKWESFLPAPRIRLIENIDQTREPNTQRHWNIDAFSGELRFFVEPGYNVSGLGLGGFDSHGNFSIRRSFTINPDSNNYLDPDPRLLINAQAGSLMVDQIGNLSCPADVYVRRNLCLFVGGAWRKFIYGYYKEYAAYGGASAPSDLRFKREVQTLPSALEKVRQLRGITFRWNEDGLQLFTKDIETSLSAGPNATEPENREVWQTERDKRRTQLATTHVGVLAQDVEAVIPEAVTTDADGYKSVRYQNLIPLLIEAIKEQDQLAARQQGEIERLKLAVGMSES